MDYKTIKNWQFSRFTVKPAWLGFENQLGFRKTEVNYCNKADFVADFVRFHWFTDRFSAVSKISTVPIL
jgi:hypothetical protein